MKCFADKLIIFIITLLVVPSPQCQCQEISLDAFSLISSQLDFLEDMCLNETENYTIFEAMKSTMSECEVTFLNGTSLNLSLNSLTTADPKEFFELYISQCSNNDAIRQRNDCSDRLKMLLSECLNETAIKAFDKIEDIAQRLDNVICSIDRQRMKHFFSAKGQECLVDNVITVGFCFLSAIPEDTIEKQELFFNLIEGKECNVIDQIENCMMPEIDACEEKTVSHIFRLLFKFFRSELLCERNMLENDDDAVTGGSDGTSISVVLATASYALLLYIDRKFK